MPRDLGELLPVPGVSGDRVDQVSSKPMAVGAPRAQSQQGWSREAASRLRTQPCRGAHWGSKNREQQWKEKLQTPARWSLGQLHKEEVFWISLSLSLPYYFSWVCAQWPILGFGGTWVLLSGEDGDS